MSRILLFGGSFDPIHLTHIKLAKEAKRQLKCDVCYFIIAKNPRWKVTSVSDEHRLNMLRLALKDEQGLEVSTIEYELNQEISYTVDTVKYLKTHIFKDDELFYLIGSDQEQKLDRWYQIDILSSLVSFAVFLRKDYPFNQDNLTKYNCIVLDNVADDVSSTSIRMLHNIQTKKAVLDYIAKNNLYYMEILHSYLKDKRLAHSVSVASLAYDLAENNNYSPTKAYLAGLLHDIGKEVGKEKEDYYMDKYFPLEKTKIGRWCYHQFIGSYIVEHDFKIEDEEILEAIRYHATGKENMSTLAKIIYSADKIDPLRGYDSSSLINECHKNINKGFLRVLKENIEFFKEKNIDYENYYTSICLNYYLNKKK